MRDRSDEVEGNTGFDDPLTEKIIGCAIKLHRVLGPGFLENIYHQGLAHELTKAKISFSSEARMQVVYDGIVLGEFLADFLVEKRVVLELKAVESLTKAHEIQLVNYLTATRIDVGLLINFGGSKVQVRRKLRELNMSPSTQLNPPVLPVPPV
jgi:GxxExxY protein